MEETELHRFIETGTRRIEKIVLDGRTLWIKRPERLSFRMRLQKGDPQKAFAQEVAAHKALADRGLPVPAIVSSGPDHIVTEDCGVPLKWLLRTEPGQRDELLAAAGRALAAWHGAGAAHGRPNLKDICWDGQRITFLDFERSGRDANLARAQEMDVLIFTFSVAVETGSSEDAMHVARDSYRAALPDLWQNARARLRRYLPLRWLLWPVTRALSAKREFAAVDPFFRFMLG